MASILFFIVHLLIISGLSFLIWRKQDIEVRQYFWPSLVLKLGAGIGLGLLYKYHYPVGDTFSFFDDGCKLTQVFWNNPSAYFNFLLNGDQSDAALNLLNNIQPRSLFLVKIVSLVNLFTADNYWTTSLYFSFISWLAAFFLFQRIAMTFLGTTWAAAIAFLFFPSVVFWSSGIIKESLALAGIFFLSRVYIALFTNMKISWWEWLLAFLSAMVAWNLKYYWMAVFIPVVITTLLVHFITRNKKLKSNLKILIWTGLFLILCFGATLVHPNFYLENFLHVLVENYNQFIQISPPDNIVEYTLEPSWWSVFMNTPKALMSALFRPFIWESSNLLQVAVGVENLVVLILFLHAFLRWRSISKSPYRLLIFSTAVYIVILSVFLALSTPNFGTLSRYKVGFLPFLIFMLMAENSLVDWIKLKLNRFRGHSKT